MGQKLSELLDIGLAAGAAVVRMMQKDFDFVQRDLEACAMRGLDLGTKVVKQ